MAYSQGYGGATPIGRAIPGAFLATPAPQAGGLKDPVSRRLFPATSSNPALQGGLAQAAGAGRHPLAVSSVVQTAASDGTVDVMAGGNGALDRVQPSLPPVEKAARVIDRTLALEESFPDLDSYCRRRFIQILPRPPCSPLR